MQIMWNRLKFKGNPMSSFLEITLSPLETQWEPSEILWDARGIQLNPCEKSTGIQWNPFEISMKYQGNQLNSMKSMRNNRSASPANKVILAWLRFWIKPWATCFSSDFLVSGNLCFLILRGGGVNPSILMCNASMRASLSNERLSVCSSSSLGSLCRDQPCTGPYFWQAGPCPKPDILG